MARNRRRTQGGVQWRWNLRNVPAQQAAVAAIPAPPPLPPIRAPPRPVVVRRGCHRGRARARRAQGGSPQGRRPIREGGHGEKNIYNAFIRNRGRYKIKRILPAVKNVEVKRRGITIRRMVATRRAIYPALRQQREY